MSTIRIQRGKVIVDGHALWQGALLELEVAAPAVAGKIPGAPAGAHGGPSRTSFPTQGPPGSPKSAPPSAADLAAIRPAPLDVIPAGVEAMLPPPMSARPASPPLPPPPPAPESGLSSGVFSSGIGGLPSPSAAFPRPPAPPPPAKVKIIGHFQDANPPRMVADGRDYPVEDGMVCRLIESQTASEARYIVSHHALQHETRVPRQQHQVLGPVHVFDYKPGSVWKPGYLHFQGDLLEVVYPARHGKHERVKLHTGWRVDLKGAAVLLWDDMVPMGSSAVSVAPPPSLPAPPPPPPPPQLAPVDAETALEVAFSATVDFLRERANAGEADAQAANAAVTSFAIWELAREAMLGRDDAQGERIAPHVTETPIPLSPHVTEDPIRLAPHGAAPSEPASAGVPSNVFPTEPEPGA